MIAQILIADDDAAITTLLGDYLAAKNHRVIAVNDGFQLAQKASEHRPHLIITDVQMPGAYGSTVYQTLHRDINTMNIHIIFMSGHPYEKLKTLLPEGPKTRFTQKPLKLEELDRFVHELLPMGGYAP